MAAVNSTERPFPQGLDDPTTLESYRARLTWIDAAEVAEEHLELIASARDGLLAGDVRPLAAYLRSERPVSFSLRQDIADLLEGKFAGGGYELTFKGKTQRPGRPRDEIHQRERAAQIGRFVQARIHQGDMEMYAVEEAAGVYEISASTVRRKWEEYKSSFPAVRPQRPRT